jgi:hypothetical protein
MSDMTRRFRVAPMEQNTEIELRDVMIACGKTRRPRRTYLDRRTMEAIMRMLSTITTTLALGISVLPLWLAQAEASQGPGVTAGTVSATMQTAMAIFVYGGSALLVAAGLIGAARQRRSRRLS